MVLYGIVQSNRKHPKLEQEIMIWCQYKWTDIVIIINLNISGEDIVCCGILEYYDKAYDRVNVKHEKSLQRIDRIFHTVSSIQSYLDAATQLK